MRPGRLDRQIILQSSTTTQGATGQPVSSWSNLATVWAHKKETSGMETNRDGEEVATGKTVFTIRFRSDVGPKNRVTYNASTYDIQHTVEVGREHYLELWTERRTD